MLGDILGLRAGETGIELTLPRFLLPLGRSSGVFLAPKPEPAARSSGLCVAEEVPDGLARDGERSGAREGVLDAPASWEGCVGVGQSVAGAAGLFKKFA